MQGWAQLEWAQKLLRRRPELQQLVSRLGRAGINGPKRRLPAQEERAGSPMGVVHSELNPMDTMGLCRGEEGRKGGGDSNAYFKVVEVAFLFD
jgi:hypothetical protein